MLPPWDADSPPDDPPDWSGLIRDDKAPLAPKPSEVERQRAHSKEQAG